MKLNLIYYKNILDIATLNFFKKFNDDFVKIGSYYVLGKAYSKDQLKDFFANQVYDIISRYSDKWDLTNPSFNLIIGSCMPQDNILLDFKNNEEYFPEKLSKLIDSDIKLKYTIREDDIKIDIILFNDIFVELFNEIFQNQNKLVKVLGNDYINTFFVQHKQLDCYTMFKTIKFLYGRTNCFNVWKDRMQNGHEWQDSLVSINELICKYINHKNDLNKSKKFKEKVYDVKNFIDSILKFN